MSDFLKTAKVGDEVGIYSYFCGEISATYSTITKKHKDDGVTLADGKRYKKDGSQYNGMASSRIIMSPDELRALVIRAEACKKLREQFAKIRELLNKDRRFITQQEKTDLLEMVNQIVPTE